MVNTIFIPCNETRAYMPWLERGLRLAYINIPEQVHIPYSNAIESLTQNVDGCACVIIHNTVDDTFAGSMIEANHTSPHIQGFGIVMYATMGDGDSTLYRRMLKYLHRLGSATGQAWIQIQHRVAPYTYNSKYIKIRNTYGQCKESI